MPAAFRLRAHEILEKAQPDDRASRFCDLGLIALIIANVIAVILESVPATGAAYQSWFDGFEVFSVMVFSVEYVLRVWSSVECDQNVSRRPAFARIRYMLTPMALIDLIVILPFYLSFFTSVDLRFLRVMRLLRLLKLSRYSTSISILLKVLRREAGAIAAALFILSMLLVMAASLAYLAEHRSQPETLGSIPKAMYWAIITMTTVGYGDVTPITFTGKLVAACIGVIGLGMVALPAGLLASGFTEELRRRRMEYKDLVNNALEDNVVTGEEAARLREARIALGFSEDWANALFEREARTRQSRPPVCPHCGASPEGGGPDAPEPRIAAPLKR
jgi:voltage-gated potassium channel